MRLAPLLGSLLAACAQPAPVQAPALPPAPCAGRAAVAFVNANVVPMDRSEVLSGQTLVVCDGKIAALGPKDQIRVAADARVLDVRGGYLMPGLVDMHAHLVREEDLALYVARGVTHVRNMWGTPLHLEWRERIRRGELRGPRIVTGGPILDGDPPVHDGSLIVQTEADAERAVAMHRRRGYDFVKVYSTLPAPAFSRLAEQAGAAGLGVVGHVPRAVELRDASLAGQRSIEHLDGFLEALQADDSPVKGRWDGVSRRKKLDHLDEGKLPGLARLLRERGVWVCPTRTVADQLAPPEQVRARLREASARYVPASDRAIWQPGEVDAVELSGNARWMALQDRIIAGLSRGGVRMVVGTDTGNPLVVPGFSLHDELAHWVRIGLTPYQALSAATRDAQELLGAGNELGILAVGRRADLVLVDGDPLRDIARTRELSGVMLRGEWLDRDELARMLASAERALVRGATSFGVSPSWSESGEAELSGTFVVKWKNAPFGAERVWLGVREDGQRVLRSRAYDQHQGQTVSLELELGSSGIGERLRLESDGAAGRGEVEVARDGAALSLSGRTLPGEELRERKPLADAAFLGVDRLLASKLLLVPRMRLLAIGESLGASAGEVALGSRASVRTLVWTVTRLEDGIGVQGRGALSRYEISPERGPKSRLALDARGAPVSFELEAYGEIVRYERVD